MARTILHADLDAFYASVEQRDRPELRGRPVLVGGGIITAASYEAKARGVHTPMNERDARARCPDAVVVAPRMSAYTEASQAVFDIFHDTSPLVEGLSVDEAFLDVTGLRKLVGDGQTIATNLRRRVANEVGLPISVGIASTKFLAKVASAVSKPDGLLEVVAGTETEFLHPLPVNRLWGVGPKTDAALAARGIVTVGDLAKCELDQLQSYVGRASARHLWGLAHNQDPRRVEVGRRRRSIGAQRSFPRSAMCRDECDQILLEVADRVSGRLRKSDQVGRTITLRLRFADMTNATRSHTLPEATQSRTVIVRTAQRLLAANWDAAVERGLTKVGLAISGLHPDSAIQLALSFDAAERPELDAAIDTIADRYGRDAVGRAALIGRSAVEVPMLAD